ncbi:MAG: WG repeat-containing protein [Proteobacteria bacterium]|nr:WG repeat-containing protein [Pseudomonadota bacterium]
MRFRITASCLLLLTGFTDISSANELSQTYSIIRHELEDNTNNGKAVINMEGKVNISTLLGEPVVACNAKWSFTNTLGQPHIGINNIAISDIPEDILKKVTLKSVKLGFVVSALDSSLFAENTWYELACDPGAMEPANSDKPSFTVPGSPAWDKLFYERGSYDGVNKDEARFADAATAKQIMTSLLKKGFARDTDSAKILTAKINLRPIKQWLEEQEKQKNKKQEENKAEKEKTEKSNSDDDDFWAGETQSSTAYDATEEDNFWAGDRTTTNQETSDKTTSDPDDFWAGNIEQERAERQAEKEEKARKEKEERLALAKQRGIYTVFESNGLKGFKDKHGNIVIPAKFYAIDDFSEGLVAVKESRNSLWGFIDKAGEWVIQPQFYSTKRFSEGLAAALEKKGKDKYEWGYIDQRGTWVIPPRYDDVSRFRSNNRALVEQRVGRRQNTIENIVIDKNGKEYYRGNGEVSFLDNGFSVTEQLDRKGSCRNIKITYREILFDDNGNRLSSETKTYRTSEFCLQAR